MTKQEKAEQLPAKRDSRKPKAVQVGPRPYLNSGRYHQM